MRKADFLQRNGLPRAVVTRHPLGLGKSVQSQPGLSSRKSHLQVQMPRGRSFASACGSGHAIDLCVERSPFQKRLLRVSPTSCKYVWLHRGFKDVLCRQHRVDEIACFSAHSGILEILGRHSKRPMEKPRRRNQAGTHT